MKNKTKFVHKKIGKPLNILKHIKILFVCSSTNRIQPPCVWQTDDIKEPFESKLLDFDFSNSFGSTLMSSACRFLRHCSQTHLL